jgi:hypothetical protein
MSSAWANALELHDRTVLDPLSGRKRADHYPRHVVRTLQRREVAGAWQGDPLNVR